MSTNKSLNFVFFLILMNKFAIHQNHSSDIFSQGMFSINQHEALKVLHENDYENNDNDDDGK